MSLHSGEEDEDLLLAETGIQDCDNYPECDRRSNCGLTLSQVQPGAKRRGSRDPRVVLITEAPDEASSQGKPYSGDLSSRIVNLFCDDRYGISLPKLDGKPFAEFLRYYRFYATSAVKCCVESGGPAIGDYVISKCHGLYLQDQILAMPNLELIIPMGRVAATSMTENSISTIQIKSLIGRRNAGIFPTHKEYGKPLVILPHPSGNNPSANPPVIRPNDGRREWEYKIRYRQALSFIRLTLGELGYDVPTKSPSSWDLPPGLSDFQ